MSTIAVVGAGIVGASLAYHLARQGAPVTLIDMEPSPAAGVTGDSFAWISDTGGDWPGGAEDLRESVLMDYRRLEAELPDVTVRWTGSLAWTNGPTQATENPGHGRHWVGRSEIATLEPNLRHPPVRALFSPTDGGVDPVRTTKALVQAARILGAQVILGSPVTSLKTVNGRVTGVMTPSAFHPASTVVLAAGTNVPTLCEPLGVTLPLEVSPAFMMRVETPPGLIRTILAGPHFEARELRDAPLLMTAPHTGELSRPALQQLAERTLESLRSTFGNNTLRLLGHRLCKRPMPPHGPIVGYVRPDLYVAVMHSAITLAATVGRLAAQDIVSGQPAPELERCRPADLA